MGYVCGSLSVYFTGPWLDLYTISTLAHPCHDAPASFITDASDRAVDAVLEQFVNGVREPLAFFSKKL